jgi:hypothetical protein
MIVCVEQATSFAVIVKDTFGDEFALESPTLETIALRFRDGDCNVVAGGTLDNTVIPGLGGYTGPYDFGSGKFSKDPLALVTREDDPEWTSFVNWVVLATIQAEEQGITQNTGDKMPLLFLFGPLFTRFFRNIIQAVGNYAEMYERNLAPLLDRVGLNTLNRSPLQPQHYPYPGFGFD